MDRFIISCAGAIFAVASEVFWKGESRFSVALWGGAGMLLLRRIVIRFPTANKALLCLFGALLLTILGLTIAILRRLSDRVHRNGLAWIQEDVPSFSYGLYRFLLIAPAYTIIEYLEARFGM